jgi:hypothetical protein
MSKNTNDPRRQITRAILAMLLLVSGSLAMVDLPSATAAPMTFRLGIRTKPLLAPITLS